MPDGIAGNSKTLGEDGKRHPPRTAFLFWCKTCGRLCDAAHEQKHSVQPVRYFLAPEECRLRGMALSEPGDQTRRLKTAQRAIALPEPQTTQDIEHQIEDIGAAIAALQSLDDLGSPEANAAARNDERKLWDKRKRLQERLK